MEDVYLNEESKQFYAAALDHIRNCNDDSWKLDEGLDKYLDKINSSSNVRTMYSQKGRSHFDDCLESYLVICYSKSVEKIITEDIPNELKAQFSNLDECQFLFRCKHPEIKAGDGATNPCLAYISDPTYWNINNVRYTVVRGAESDHNNFWEFISRRLSRL